MEPKMLLISIFLIVISVTAVSLDKPTDCAKLKLGQFLCPDPDSNYTYIDPKTQSVIGCQKSGKATGKQVNLIDILIGYHI